MSVSDLAAVALLVTGVLAASLASLQRLGVHAGLRMLLELWTAAVLLHLTTSRDLRAIAAAATMVALRGLLQRRRSPAHGRA
jgi:hypothetical protein